MMPPTGQRRLSFFASTISTTQQASLPFLLSHIDADVDHPIKLHVDYPQAALDIDTDKLWIILRQSVTQNGSFNVSEIKIE